MRRAGLAILTLLAVAILAAAFVRDRKEEPAAGTVATEEHRPLVWDFPGFNLW